MRAIGYIRVSGKAQVDGDGPDRQAIAIRNFCQEHKLDLLTCSIEGGVSGTVDAMDRPSFSAMIEEIMDRQDIDMDPVGCVVVERLDRLARDLMVQEILMRECRVRGIKVFAVDQGRLDDMADNGGDPTRVLIRQVMGAIAQWEKTQTVLKLSGARARKRAKTGRCEGRKPFGERDMHDKTVLFKVLEMHNAGLKTKFIVNALTQEGLINRGTNAPYSRSFINRLIRERGGQNSDK